MLRMLEKINISKFSHRAWVFTSGDSMSIQKCKSYEEILGSKYTVKPPSYIEIPRARKVGQSWKSTVITSLICLRRCFDVMLNESPDIVCSP